MQSRRSDAPSPAAGPRPAKAEPIPITHADRVIFPADGVTKGDVAEYYARVADRMAPYLQRRLVSVIRVPDSIEAETFFQRHPMPGMKRGVFRVKEATRSIWRSMAPRGYARPRNSALSSFTAG